MEMEEEEAAASHSFSFKKRRILSSSSTATPSAQDDDQLFFHNNNSNESSKKTKLCRRFCRFGVCPLGSECNYAHGIADLRRSSSSSSFNQFQQPKLCRMFAYNNKHCTYGHNCRFLHSTPPPPPTTTTLQFHHSPPPPAAQLGKFDYKVETGGTPAAATTTNASTSTLATTPNLHKNGPYGGVKCMFKKIDFLKISRIYADWI